jgi:DNA helicase II / ATP-dependent DNA helicase PcrA
MRKTELIHWLQQQQTTIETIIYEAASAFIEQHKQLPNFGYDLACAQQEAYNLMNNEDLCYDRYTTPLGYSLWYQARRINVFTTHFIDKILEACLAEQPVTVFDLGAGTGCVQFCFGLVYAAMKKSGKQAPLLRVINVDSSPFMLSYLKEYLWPAAKKHYSELGSIPIQYDVYSWSNRTDVGIVNPWICASYLFDSSENEDYLEENFKQLIEAFKPAKILMLTSAQPKKQHFMQTLSNRMKSLQYQVIPNASNPRIFNGTLNRVNSLRSTLIQEYQLRASTRSVTWDDGSFSAIGLEKQQSGFGFDILSPNELDLFNPPIRVRREVQLNEEQTKAAAFETRPSIITGPAGCGKSVVITEKILNVLEEYQWIGPLQILVTTFNKSLLKQLREWMTDLILGKRRDIHQEYYKVTNNENDGTGHILLGLERNIIIKFVHFEMLGRYIGNIQYTAFNETEHKQVLQQFAKEIKGQLAIEDNEMEEVLNADFLQEEYHRVIYGLQCKIALGEQYYQDIDRTGRGKKPRLERGKKRKAVWLALEKYAKWMHLDPKAGQSYLARRQLLYNKLNNGELNDLFDYVFVDEFQDCTKTDFRLMTLLVKDPNNLVLAGDLAQAVHIGQSGIIPKEEGQSRRIYHKLNGSYRLPFRISEAIQPLSAHINNNSIDKDVTAIITPYKGSPPGARVIVVYGKTSSLLAEKIKAIKAKYELFNLETITILEKDEELKGILRYIAPPVETTTILRLKGLEKEFIIWSLQAEVEYENEVAEFAYTIMTRTNCLLVVAITDNCKEYYTPLFTLFRRDRLIFWDNDSANIFDVLSNLGSKDKGIV